MTAEEALLEPKKGGQIIATKDPSDRPLFELQVDPIATFRANS